MKRDLRNIINWVLITLVVLIFMFYRPSSRGALQADLGGRSARNRFLEYQRNSEYRQEPEYRQEGTVTSGLNGKQKFPKSAVPIIAGEQVLAMGNTDEETEEHLHLEYLDLDIEVPTVDELYEKLVLITGFSDNHYREAMGFIGTAQRFMPGKQIIVYDLGIKNKAYLQMTKDLCNVQIRKFHFEQYPPHVKDLHKYAWKIAIINIALNEFGAIYWGDSSIRFKDSLKVLIPGIERYHGWFPSILGFNPHNKTMHHTRMTVNGTYDKIGVNRSALMAEANVQPHIQAGNQLFFNSSTIQTHVLQPWMECGMNPGCIAPPGSSLKDHRYDASALSLIAYKYMKNVFSPNDTNIDRLHDIISVSRGSDGFKFKPRKCESTNVSH